MDGQDQTSVSFEQMLSKVIHTVETWMGHQPTMARKPVKKTGADILKVIKALKPTQVASEVTHQARVDVSRVKGLMAKMLTEWGDTYKPGQQVSPIKVSRMLARSIQEMDFIPVLKTIGVTAADERPPLQVWYGAMPESNGKSNWTAILHRGDLAEGFTFSRSEYNERVRYYADEMRWLIGEIKDRPCPTEYDDQQQMKAPDYGD